MASPAPVTRPSGGAQGGQGGGGKKIMGVDRTTFFIVGGGALGLGLLYFFIKGKQAKGQGQGGGQGSGQGSPTGLRREHLVIWINQHGRHGGRHG